MRVPSERSLRAVAAAIAVAGIGVAAYIAIADASGGSPVCIGSGHGCEAVTESRYGHVLGINVAVIGVGGYALLLGAALAGGDIARFLGFSLSAIGFGVSAYLTYVEAFVLDAVCQWCLASAVLITALLVVSAARTFAYAGVPS